jgi:tetratricopeptide (TPR) repeat protein
MGERGMRQTPPLGVPSPPRNAMAYPAWLRNFLCCGIAVWSVPALAGGATPAASPGKVAADAQPSADLSKRIGDLIEQLGDPRFPVRERAQAELAELGTAAFDALSVAQTHRDLEIAHRARSLVQAIRMEWVRDSDSEEIRKLLADYDSQPDQVRRKRIETLAERPQSEGLAPLCRIVRFEKSVLLSKLAALAVMDQKRPAKSEWTERARIIQEESRLSQRPAVRWLLTYAEFPTRAEESLSAWKELVAAEGEQTRKSPTHEQRGIQAGLLRQQVVMHLEAGQQNEALITIRQMLDVGNNDSESLAGLVEWVIRQEAWPLVDEVAQRLERQATSDAYLMYLIAEAYQNRGDPKRAEQIAGKAVAQHQGDIEYHFRMAYRLQGEGLMRWAETEYRAVIEANPRPNVALFISLSYGLLGELLNDQERFKDAADTLEQCLKNLPGRVGAQPGSGLVDRSPDQVRARMHYFRAKQYLADNDSAKQIEHLNKAIQYDQAEADALIALYRAETRPAERDKVVRKIRAAAALFKQKLITSPDDPTAMNQYAWLVGNTEGDYDEAIRLSKRSLELASESQQGGYLDTLAHCYATKKDYENAVKYQTQAMELEPHSGEIRRAYERFKALRDEQKAAGNKKAKPAD